MTETKIELSGSCSFTLTTYENIGYKDVCLDYTEHSSDHWHSDIETSISLDADKAREIVAFMQKAFPEIEQPAQQCRTDGRCQYAIDSGAEGMGHCPKGKCIMPAQQEPVAWRTFDGEGGYEYRSYDMNEQYAQEWEQRNPKHKGWVEPLYTASAPCPTCEALARTVMMDQTSHDTSPPAPVQHEPVGWMDDDGNLHREKPHQSYGPEPRPLVFGYTSPQPAQRTWVGLTEPEVNDCYESIMFDQNIEPSRMGVYLEIEAKLKEKNA